MLLKQKAVNSLAKFAKTLQLFWKQLNDEKRASKTQQWLDKNWGTVKITTITLNLARCNCQALKVNTILNIRKQLKFLKIFEFYSLFSVASMVAFNPIHRYLCFNHSPRFANQVLNSSVGTIDRFQWERVLLIVLKRPGLCKMGSRGKTKFIDFKHDSF